MATPPKFMRFPFAVTGDKDAIPDEAQASGSLSYSEGFGLDYERDPTKDAKAKRMPRGGTNQLLYDATSNIHQYQLYGVPYWYGAASNGGTAIQYKKNAMVRFASGNSENIYISLKDNNTDAPTVSASWFLFQPYNSTLFSRLSVTPFVPVESTTLTTPPANLVQGKAYLIPANATGLWAGKSGQLAEWDGSNWVFTLTPDGHSVGLPDGRVFTKVSGNYVEFLASINYVNNRRVPLAQLLSRPFIAVSAIDVKTPPSSPFLGETYVVPNGSTGAWTGKSGLIAEFDGYAWYYQAPIDGHSVGLPDGRIFTCINNQYIEKIASDSQSGKWNFATDVWGDYNAIGLPLSPWITQLRKGLKVRYKAINSNTGPATLDVCNLGAKPIIYHETGEPLIGGDIQIGDIVELTYDGTSWRFKPSLVYINRKISLDSQSGKWNYATTTGTNSAYTINLSPQPPSPPASLFVKFHAENTGAATIKIGNLLPINIMRLGGSPLQAGDLPQDGVRELLFDGTNYQISAQVAKNTNVTGAATLNTEQSLQNSVLTAMNLNADFPFGSLRNGILTISQAGRYVLTLTSRVSVNVTANPQNTFGNPIIYLNNQEIAVATSGIFGNVTGIISGLAATTTTASLLQIGDQVKVAINAGSLSGSGLNNIKLYAARFAILKMD